MSRQTEAAYEELRTVAQEVVDMKGTFSLLQVVMRKPEITGPMDGKINTMGRLLAEINEIEDQE